MEKPKFAKIVDNENLVRDTSTNAVLNTDLTALQQYRAKREKDRRMAEDVDMLKQKMSNIENLLQQLVNRD
jgi:hypothetical protein